MAKDRQEKYISIQIFWHFGNADVVSTYSGAELVLAPLPSNLKAVQSVVGSPGSI
jgi:hypothetical protein